MAGHALVADGEREFLEGDVEAVVLGQLEAEAGVAVLVLLDQVERAGVAPGDLPGLRQDQLEERVRVALGRELDADVVELLQLLGHPGEIRLGLRLVEDEPEVGEGVGEGFGQDGRRDGLGQIGVHLIRGERRDVGGVRQHHDLDVGAGGLEAAGELQIAA
ncbi:MAG: hypothetical protein HYV92_06350 [Candidatus Rokubacteria bacterium]|nr:hypothetical protein [Candidatus Rokubacteria bacterium]